MVFTCILRSYHLGFSLAHHFSMPRSLEGLYCMLPRTETKLP